MRVARNTVVAIDYTLKDSSGAVLDSSQGREPLRYLHGNGHVVSGLESALEGAKPGDRLEVSLDAGDAYGERDERLVVQVARSQFDKMTDLAVGSRFVARTDDGEKVFTVTEIGAEQVTVDGNHPLAGISLHFDVEVKDVREATAEELDHGHAH
jgi:FKBP-type peptidyl-prolyl cis-trans isomerase SlyD